MDHAEQLEAAKLKLAEAVKFDKNKDYAKAVACYEQGARLLTVTLNLMPYDAKERTALREHIVKYVSRAEELKKQVTVKVNCVKKLHIQEDATGYSYERIFEPCLDSRSGPITEVDVEEPWIQSPHQIHQFVAFCELLVTKCCPSLKRIKLRTQRKETESAKQEAGLKEVAQSLLEHKVELVVQYDTFHDREIRFDNGWIVKIGRGLDIYKGIGKYTLFSSHLERRKCKSTNVDMYQRVMK